MDFCRKFKIKLQLTELLLLLLLLVFGGTTLTVELIRIGDIFSSLH
jgi:hypothetical protein